MTYKTNLKQYVPIIYKDILEMDKIIEIDENLLDEVFNLTKEVRDNQYVMTANNRGLMNFENLLEINADLSVESIEFRRERIINQLSSNLPYTYRYLIRTLDQFLGEDGYEITPDFKNFTINLLVKMSTYGSYKMLRTLLANIVPANVLVSITNDFNYETTNKMYLSGVVNQNITYQLETE